MIVSNLNEITGKILESSEVKNVSMKVLVGENEGWNDHVMRVLELGVDGYSPNHSHPWPHINYMIEGEGILTIEGKDYPVKAGSYAFVPENKIHQFRNTGNTYFKFICIVPKEGHK